MYLYYYYYAYVECPDIPLPPIETRCDRVEDDDGGVVNLFHDHDVNLIKPILCTTRLLYK